MGIMQLINLVLFWVFIGFLTSKLAKKRGRNPNAWFCIGLFLGLLGLLLLFILPAPHARKRKNQKPYIPPQLKRESDAWIKMWYYLDLNHKQKGPIEFPDLINHLKNKTIKDESFVWGEGMDEWKRLNELPDIVKEIEQS